MFTNQEEAQTPDVECQPCKEAGNEEAPKETPNTE